MELRSQLQSERARLLGAQTLAAALEQELQALRSTRLYRWTALPRRVYGQLRRQRSAPLLGTEQAGRERPRLE
jgi:hypothetical protein